MNAEQPDVRGEQQFGDEKQQQKSMSDKYRPKITATLTGYSICTIFILILCFIYSSPNGQIAKLVRTRVREPRDPFDDDDNEVANIHQHNKKHKAINDNADLSIQATKEMIQSTSTMLRSGEICNTSDTRNTSDDAPNKSNIVQPALRKILPDMQRNQLWGKRYRDHMAHLMKFNQFV
jgi:hypothetical protein